MEIEEIKKALECCADNDINSCERCPIEIECYTEVINCKKEAFDLINRQQADKEALIAGQETLQKALAEKIAEIESVNKRADMWHREAELNAAELIKMQAEIERLLQKLQQPQAEAIKAFAERLKPMYKTLCVDMGDWYNEIDTLVKEMVGDAE